MKVVSIPAFHPFDILHSSFPTALLHEVAKGAWIGNGKLPGQESHSADSAMPAGYGAEPLSGNSSHGP